MAHRLHIGKKFEDFSAFESAIERYQNAEYVQFWKRDSRTISAAQSRLPKKTLNPRLKYYEVSFHCIQGGKTFKSNSKGMREQRYVYFSSVHLSVFPFVCLVVSNNVRYSYGNKEQGLL